jgi:hypothetical protein
LETGKAKDFPQLSHYIAFRRFAIDNLAAIGHVVSVTRADSHQWYVLTTGFECHGKADSPRRIESSPRSSLPADVFSEEPLQRPTSRPRRHRNLPALRQRTIPAL